MASTTPGSLAITYRFRHGTIEDIRRNSRLLEPERPLYSTKLWRQMPELIEQLCDAKRLRIAAIEEASGKVRLVGASGFWRKTACGMAGVGRTGAGKSERGAVRHDCCTTQDAILELTAGSRQ